MDMSTSAFAPAPAAAKRRKHIFSKEDEISLLKSLLEKTANLKLEGSYSETQIRYKIDRMRQKYRKAVKSGESTFKNDHEREVYKISCKIWSRVVDEGVIRWSDYPHVMKHVPSGNEALYKQGLEGLGEDVVRRFERKWMALELEESAIRSKQSELVRRHTPT